MRRILPTLAAVLGLLVAIPQAAAEPAARPATKGPQCFSIRSFENWKAPDAKTIYIRVNLHQYYRLDLAASCPTLLSANSHLITNWRGSSWVCSALDWDLKVSEDSVRGFASPCIVKKMTALTETEAAAIPRKFKP
jgi:hypothetical protein